MTAQGRRATNFDSTHGLEVVHGQRIGKAVGIAECLEDVGYFQSRSAGTATGLGGGVQEGCWHEDPSWWAKDGKCDKSNRSSGLWVASKVFRVKWRYQAVERIELWPRRI